jgi:hypothetical protein
LPAAESAAAARPELVNTLSAMLVPSVCYREVEAGVPGKRLQSALQVLQVLKAWRALYIKSTGALPTTETAMEAMRAGALSSE